MNTKNTFCLVVGFLLVIIVLAACAPATSQSQTQPVSPSIAAPQEVQRIPIEESKAAFDSRAALFLDVRTADSYAASHIPGALLIPLGELEARINELDPNQWIITYCT